MSYQTPQKERSEANDLTNLFQDYSSDMLTYARYRLGGLHNDMAEGAARQPENRETQAAAHTK